MNIKNNTLQAPKWDLSDFYNNLQDTRIEADFKQAALLAKTFREKYRGKLSSLTPKELAQALQDYELLDGLLGKPLCYAHLLHSADNLNQANGAALSNFQERCTAIVEDLTFFELEWNEVPAELAQGLLEAPDLKTYKYYLEDSRKFKPHQFSEKEEIIWDNLSLVASTAWGRLFDETLSALRFPIEGKQVSLEEALSALHSPEREKRKIAAEAIHFGLKDKEHLLTFIMNATLQEHSINDRLREFATPLSNRNLNNQISDEAVQALIETTEKNSSLVARFYRLKRKILGHTELFDYDRYAPLSTETAAEAPWAWDKARTFVTEAYRDFSPELGSIVTLFFERNWIDAQVAPGKQGGAFSAGTVAALHPYILMNFLGQTRDVSTLAHELGHGVHQYLSRGVGDLQMSTPLTTAETASVFGEFLVFEKLLKEVQSTKERLSLLASKLEEIFATVFRQICMTRFEARAHLLRRSKGELVSSDLEQIWMEENRKMFGDSVTLSEHYGNWWSYIPHFIHSPFYCYAYGFGLLLSIGFYQRHKAGQSGFQEAYLEILRAGGSLSPEDLAMKAGIDLSDPAFWQSGFDFIENLIEQAEQS